MANEETEVKKKEETEAPPKKKGFMKLIVLLLLAVLALGGGAGFAAWKFSLWPFTQLGMVDKKIEKPKEQAKKDGNEMGPLKPLDTFIVNLVGDKGERYLKVTMNMELDDPKTLDEVTKKEPQLRDAVIILLSSKAFADVMGSEGKEKLKKEILARINSFIGTGRVRRVFFTEFVIQ